jgi:hypothetical protein
VVVVTTVDVEVCVSETVLETKEVVVVILVDVSVVVPGSDVKVDVDVVVARTSDVVRVVVAVAVTVVEAGWRKEEQNSSTLCW